MRISDLDDKDRTPHTQPNRTDESIEQKVAKVRTDTGYGRRRIKRRLFIENRIEIHENTVEKIIKRLGLPQKVYRNAWRSKTRKRYNANTLLPFERNEVDTKEILDKKGLPPSVYKHFLSSDWMPKYQWTWIDVASRLRFLAYSHSCSWTNGQIFHRYVRAWLALFGVTDTLNTSIDGGREWSATTQRSFEYARATFYEPLAISPSLIRKGHPEDNAYVERSHRTDDEEFYVPYGPEWNTEKDFLRRANWWTIMYNTIREHQGIEDGAPLQKLRQFMPQIHPEIALMPSIILDRHLYTKKVVHNVCGVYPNGSVVLGLSC